MDGVRGNPRLGIIGAGRMGGALGLALKQKGYLLCGVCNSSFASTVRAAELLDAKPFVRPDDLARESQVLFITVRDESIASVVQQVADRGGFYTGQVVIHSSGSLPSSVLEPARKAGAWGLSIHPLQSCPDPEHGARNFRGAVFSVEGDTEALPLAEKLVSDLGGACFNIDPASKPLYHAAACVASNYLVTLLDLARNLLLKAGLPPELMVDALYPLIRGTLANVAQTGIPEALTGPISRGDAATVADHLASMAVRAPEAISLYSGLGLKTIEVAQRKGSIDLKQARRLRNVLRGGNTHATDFGSKGDAAM